MVISMSRYMYRANNNVCDDGKLHVFYCNECGSVDLTNPRNSESDHRDVLRFSCLKCSNRPYWSWMDTFDVIEITDDNKEALKKEFCEQRGWNPDEYQWRMMDNRLLLIIGILIMCGIAYSVIVMGVSMFIGVILIFLVAAMFIFLLR